jgi:hypothetical protein
MIREISNVPGKEKPMIMVPLWANPMIKSVQKK